jgi:hypothetical protein
VRGRRVHQQTRLVLTRDQENVIDPEIGRQQIIPRGTLWTLPLDANRASSAQSIRGGGKEHAVCECSIS